MNTARQLMERRKSYGKVQRRAVSPAPQKQSSAKKPAKPAAKKPQPNANPSSQLKGGVNKKLKKSAATPEASSPKKPAHGPSSVVMQDGPESPPPLVERFSAEELLAAGDDFEDIEAMCKLESPQEGQKKANNNNSTPMSRPPPLAVDNSQAAAAQAAAVQAQAAAKAAAAAAEAARAALEAAQAADYSESEGEPSPETRKPFSPPPLPPTSAHKVVAAASSSPSPKAEAPSASVSDFFGGASRLLFDRKPFKESEEPLVSPRRSTPAGIVAKPLTPPPVEEEAEEEEEPVATGAEAAAPEEKKQPAVKAKAAERGSLFARLRLGGDSTRRKSTSPPGGSSSNGGNTPPPGGMQVFGKGKHGGMMTSHGNNGDGMQSQQALEAMSEQLESITACMKVEQQARCQAEAELQEAREQCQGLLRHLTETERVRKEEAQSMAHLRKLLEQLQAENKGLKSKNEQLASQLRPLLSAR